MLLEETLQEVSNRSSSPRSPAVVHYDTNEEGRKKDLERGVPEQSDDLVEEVLPDLLRYGIDPALGTYTGVPLDYDSLPYGPTRARVNSSEQEDEYGTFSLSDDTESETMTMEEAKEMIQNIQYAVVTGTLSDLDYTDRRRFATWTIFNSAERELNHRLCALTSNVDYSRTF